MRLAALRGQYRLRKEKFRVCGDVSIGKAEHPSTPELRKISIWRRFLSFASFPSFPGKERK